MPVFDFNATPDEKKPAECTYTVIRSNENEATIEKPMMILDNKTCKWEHHSCGVFTNPIKRTSFEFQQEDGTVSADILKIDARFVSLLKWLGENHINVRLSGENTEEGYAVYKIREIAFGGGTEAKDSWTGEDWEYPSMQDIVGSRKLMVLGLTNDQIGYIIADNNYHSILTENEELLTVSKHEGSRILLEFKSLYESVR